MKYTKRFWMTFVGLLLLVVLSVYTSAESRAVYTPDVNSFDPFLEPGATLYSAGYKYYYPDSIRAGNSMNLYPQLQELIQGVPVTWNSQNPQIATVTQSGYVTGIAPGTTYITATQLVDNYQTVHVFMIQVVSADPTSISLYPYITTILVGETETLKLTIKPTDYANYVNWTSSDPSVATVDANGVVTGVSKGTAEISAVCGNKKDTCKITVTKELSASDAGVQMKTITLLSNKKGTLKGNGTEKFNFTLPFSATIRYVNHGNTSLQLRVYNGSTSVFDSSVAVSEKNYKIKLENKYSSSSTFSFAVKNTDPYKETSYNFSLLMDIPVSPSTLWLDQTSLSMPEKAVTSVVIHYIGAEKNVYFSSINSSVAGIVSSKSSNGLLVLESKAMGSTDIIVYTKSTVVSDVAVLHVDVMNPKGSYICMPEVTGVIAKGDTDTLNFKLNWDASVLISKDRYYTNYFDTSLYDSNGQCVCSNSVSFVPNLKAGTYYLKVTVNSKYSSSRYGVSVTAMEFRTIATASLTLDKTALTLEKGKTATLKESFQPSNANEVSTWVSSNTKVATVDKGIVIATGFGTATITVRKGSKTATCNVTVPERPTQTLKLNKTNLELYEDDERGAYLFAYYTPEDSTDKMTWSRSNSNVYLWDKGDGVCRVEPAWPGVTKVTVKMGKLKATCTVRVIESYDFDDDYKRSFEILTGEKISIKNDCGVTLPDGKWSVLNSSIATVNKNGMVTGVKAGKTTVYLKSNSYTFSWSITVKQAKLKLGISKMHLFVCNDSKMNCQTIIIKQKASNSVTFSSGDKSIATVNKKGKVTAKAPGTVTITVKSGDQKKTCKVRVDKLAYGYMKGSIVTLSGYRGGYTPDYGATIEAYDLYSDTLNYRFTQKNKSNYNIKLPVGKYRVEYHSGNCEDFVTYTISKNKTITYDARLS